MLHIMLGRGLLFRIQPKHTKGRMQPLQRLLVHQALEGGGEDSHLVQTQAGATQAALEETLCRLTCMLREEGRWRRGVPCIATTHEALHEPTVPLHEDPVEQVAHPAGGQALPIGLRQGSEDRPHRVLERRRTAFRSSTTTATENTLELVEEVASALRRRRRLVAQKGAGGGGTGKQSESKERNCGRSGKNRNGHRSRTRKL
mmetsp:Transcript_28063/g.79686  ORF Transcript_28063/g.79686 Transcript_28063/m.79686 type:complete len:202 (-) Transcript_28063:55-660(-)